MIKNDHFSMTIIGQKSFNFSLISRFKEVLSVCLYPTCAVKCDIYIFFIVCRIT